MRDIRGAAVSALAVGLTAGLVTLAGPAGAADTPGCVTHDEFRRLESGMRTERVRNIFDSGAYVRMRDNDPDVVEPTLLIWYEKCRAAVPYVAYTEYTREGKDSPWRLTRWLWTL